MKFMKLGNRPDSFYTEEATRAMISDVPSDLTIQIKNISYLLHKYPILPKCGLIQDLFSELDEPACLNINDIPGGDEAFELCAKFCYGITINLSAHNFVSAYCAAKFLHMTQNGNFVMKLETFFSSCILQGWKDSVEALKNTDTVYEWSENLGIIRRCIESIVDKILTPPPKVTWSYTYTRPGYNKKSNKSSVPKDWWTEDISFLGIDMFRCIITSIRSTNILQPQLIGEALHVYAFRWLPDINLNDCSSSSEVPDSPKRKQHILEAICSLIPPTKGSVSVRFLLRLLKMTNFLKISPVTKAELIRLAGLQLEEAKPNDLLFPTRPNSYDIEMVKTVLQSFLRQWKRQSRGNESENSRSLCDIGKLIDSYMQIIAKEDKNVTFEEVISLVETLPGNARPLHDDLYKMIIIYLKEHSDLNKSAKKQLCRILDCEKLSPEARAHAVKNELLPLRVVVQLLFFEQEKGNVMAKNTCIASMPRFDRVSEASTSGVSKKIENGDGKAQSRHELSFKFGRMNFEKKSEIIEEQSSETDNALVRRVSGNTSNRNRGK